jgi:hypothetical protein
MGVRENPEQNDGLVVYFQNKDRHVAARLFVHALDKEMLVRQLEKLAQDVREH